MLTFLDECGFSPTQPVNYTWVRRGERKRMPYENPHGRRLNALVAVDRTGPTPAVFWASKPKALVAADLLRFLDALPVVPVPHIVVLDNASMHRNTALRAARPALWTKRIYLYYLPPSSPDLNDIERLFREVKHDELPERRYPTLPLLAAAVDDAFTRVEARLLAKCQVQLRSGA